MIAAKCMRRVLYLFIVPHAAKVIKSMRSWALGLGGARGSALRLKEVRDLGGSMCLGAQQWLLTASPEVPCRLPAFQVISPSDC